MRDRSAVAARWDAQLRQGAFPFWRSTVDREGGGYRVEARERPLGPVASALVRFRAHVPSLLGGRPRPLLQKHLVSQARLVWALSLAHRLGYGDGYLEAAEHGHRFLVERLLDREHGGFFWRADMDGRVIDPRKTLYGQAFAVFALVELHRASGRVEPLAEARAVFDLVQARLHEPGGGWREHAQRDFAPVAAPRGVELPWLNDRIGLHSANGHLHWMEALTDLLPATGAPEVGTALGEAVDICRRFFPVDAGRACQCCTPEGAPFDPGEISYGHSVEFAWLMIRAQEALGEPPDWERFDALLRHALAHGFDARRGGFYLGGHGDQPADRREKVWWVQAEGLVALTMAVGRESSADYERALDRLLDWLVGRQILPDGVWLPRLSPRGRVRSRMKAGTWKAAYHEVRAMVRFITAFGRAPGTPPRTRPASPTG